MYRRIAFLLKYRRIDHFRNILIAIKKDLVDWYNVSSYYLLIPKSKWDVSVNVDSTLFHTRFTLDLLERIGSVSVVLSLLNIFVYLPCYVILKKTASYKYVLYENQYFYTTTAAYFRGDIPVIVTFIFLSISSIICSLVFVALIPVPKVSVDIESVEAKTPSYMSVKAKKRFPLSKIIRWSFYQLVNATVAMIWNCGYVYILYLATSVQHQAIEFLQHILALVTLFNIFKLAPKFTSLQKHTRKSSKHQNLVLMNVVYMLFAPIIAVLLFSPWCLYYHIFPRIVTPTYYQNEYIYTDNQLEEVQVEISNHPLTAPWYYSFQCSSSVLVAYFPILSTMYLCLSILDPILKLLCMFLSNEGIITSIMTDMWSRLLITLTSPIYLYAGTSSIQTLSSSNSPSLPGIEMTTFASVIEGRLSGEGKTINSKKLLNPRVLMTRVCMDIMILLTFGLASPVLGVFVTLSILANSIVLRLAIGRFLSISKAKGDDIFEINSKRIENLLRDEWRCLEDNWSLIAIVSGLFWYLFVFDYLAEYNIESGVILGAFKALLVPAVLIYFKRLFTSMNYGDDDIEVSKQTISENNSKRLAMLARLKQNVSSIHFYIWKRLFGMNALSKVIDSGIGYKNTLETTSPLAHRIIQKVHLRSGTVTIDQYKKSLHAYYSENNPEKVNSLDTIIEAYASFEQALLDQLEDKYKKPVIILKKTGNDVRQKLIEEVLNQPKISRLEE